MKKIIITIDGHSACGKSTLAKSLANELNYGYIDTGAMYRAVTFYFLENRVNIQKTAEMERALTKINITFKNTVGGNRTYLNGKDVEDVIRKMFVSKNVSHVAAISTVRRMVVKQQKEMGKLKGIVMEGRDIGTVVFPKAELKIFLTADENIRTQRRYDELTKKGQKVSLKAIKDNLHERDHIDSTRKDSPLKKAKQAVIIDNSNITQKEQLAMVLGLSKERIRRLSTPIKKTITKPTPQKRSNQPTQKSSQKNTKSVPQKRTNQVVSKKQNVAQKIVQKNQPTQKSNPKQTKPAPQKRTNQAAPKKQNITQKIVQKNQPTQKSNPKQTKPVPQKRTNQAAPKKQNATQKIVQKNQPTQKSNPKQTKPAPKKRTNQAAPKKQNATQKEFLKTESAKKPGQKHKNRTPQKRANRPVVKKQNEVKDTLQTQSTQEPVQKKQKTVRTKRKPKSHPTNKKS